MNEKFIVEHDWNRLSIQDRTKVLNYLTFLGHYICFDLLPSTHLYCNVITIYHNSVFVEHDWVVDVRNRLPLSDIRKMIELSPV